MGLLFSGPRVPHGHLRSRWNLDDPETDADRALALYGRHGYRQRQRAKSEDGDAYSQVLASTSRYAPA
jgi:hypothetical protein